MLTLVYIAKVTYSYPALEIDMNNWFDGFCLNIVFVICVCGISIMIDIVLMIVSIVEIKKIKRGE
jgi:hypothetical protein